MKKFNEILDSDIFYMGTIIVIKNLHRSPKGKSDAKFCLVSRSYEGKFLMLDLYSSMGGVIIQDLLPNIENHHAVNKEGIKNWVIKHIELFYSNRKYTDEQINDMICIEKLEDYFTQANKDILV